MSAGAQQKTRKKGVEGWGAMGSGIHLCIIHVTSNAKGKVARVIKNGKAAVSNIALAQPSICQPSEWLCR